MEVLFLASIVGNNHCLQTQAETRSGERATPWRLTISARRRSARTSMSTSSAVALPNFTSKGNGVLTKSLPQNIFMTFQSNV